MPYGIWMNNKTFKMFGYGYGGYGMGFGGMGMGYGRWC